MLKCRLAATATSGNAAREAVIIDMGDLNDITNRDNNKKQDTLFGPNIGVVNGGPAWTDASGKQKQPLTDHLTPDVVKGWIAKSKEVSMPALTPGKRVLIVPSGVPTDYNVASTSQPQASHSPSLPFVRGS
jgi:hypothetical protein